MSVDSTDYHGSQSAKERGFIPTGLNDAHDERNNVSLNPLKSAASFRPINGPPRTRRWLESQSAKERGFIPTKIHGPDPGNKVGLNPLKSAASFRPGRVPRGNNFLCYVSIP